MGISEVPSLVPPQWIPTVTCPAPGACNLSCDAGFATDEQGCTVCRCLSAACSLEIDSNSCPLANICPYGLASNQDGCPICKCRRPTPCPAVIPIKCKDSCPQGFASDEFGCPDISACRCIRRAWDPLCSPQVLQKCNRMCSHGYATDSNSCEICACRMPFSIGAFVSISTPVYQVYWREIGFPHGPYSAAALVPTSLCPLVDSQVCQLVCPNGRATDLAGCPVCRCKTPQENCPTVDPLLCPLVHTCPFGLVTGRNGCEICVCRREMRCEPVSDLTCSTRCVHGHSTDSYGCPVCQSCARHVGECPPVNPWNCMKQCTYGYATNQEGCPVCKCKQPGYDILGVPKKAESTRPDNVRMCHAVCDVLMGIGPTKVDVAYACAFKYIPDMDWD
ncbi:uncharacterized protein [Diadema antillarum]|uniref:uncharacterized protein n=1 Tax=Diadema antillarum TaxID=105358 RepID=UPI003A88B86D